MTKKRKKKNKINNNIAINIPKENEVLDVNANISNVNLQESINNICNLLTPLNLRCDFNIYINNPFNYKFRHEINIHANIIGNCTNFKMLYSYSIQEYLKNYLNEDVISKILYIISKNTNLLPSNKIKEILLISDYKINKICDDIKNESILQDTDTYINIIKKLKNINGNIPILSRFFLNCENNKKYNCNSIILIQILHKFNDNNYINIEYFIKHILHKIANSNKNEIIIRFWKLKFNGKLTKCTQSINIKILKKWFYNCKKYSKYIFIQSVSYLPDSDDINLFPLSNFTINIKEIFTVKVILTIPKNITYPADYNQCGSIYNQIYKCGGPYLFEEKYVSCFLGKHENLDNIYYINNIKYISDNIRTICKNLKFTIS